MRAVGLLRTFAGSKSITSFVIRPLQDPNELSFHLLESIHVHLAQTKGPAAFAGKQGQQLAAGGRAPMQAAAGGAGAGGAQPFGVQGQGATLQEEVRAPPASSRTVPSALPSLSRPLPSVLPI